MTITLTPKQEKFIAEAVASGLYTNPNKVIAQSPKLPADRFAEPEEE